MSNLTVFIIFALVNFGLLGLVFRLFGKNGVLAYICLSVIAANIQVNKGVIFDFGIFQLEATLGNVMYAGVFLATDLLNEKYGYKIARHSVHISVFVNLAFTAIMFVATLFNGLEYSKEYNDALELFFSINGGALKAVVVGNLVYLISQSVDVFIYAKIKDWNSTKGTLWIRNNGSTFVSQLLDTILVTIGFSLVGIIPFDIIVSVIITTLIVKYIAAILDTPFLYIMNKIKPREIENLNW